MIIKKILCIVVMIISFFLCGVLGIAEFFDPDFSKKFKILCWTLAAVDIALIIFLTRS